MLSTEPYSIAARSSWLTHDSSHVCCMWAFNVVVPSDSAGPDEGADEDEEAAALGDGFLDGALSLSNPFMPNTQAAAFHRNARIGHCAMHRCAT